MGYDVMKYEFTSNPETLKKKIFQSYGIDLILDVGANSGQFGNYLRSSLEYAKKIISFEPQISAYKKLTINSQKDKLWEIHNYALGSKVGDEEINTAGNSYSSSILQMLPSHEKAAPESIYIGKEQIQIKTIDSIFKKIYTSKNNVLLKIDTQGFEEEVLKGATTSLQFINTIQLEMSLIPLYKGQLLFNEMYQWLNQKGYQLIFIDQEFSDRITGQLLQINGIFHRF